MLKINYKMGDSGWVYNHAGLSARRGYEMIVVYSVMSVLKYYHALTSIKI